MEDFSIRAIIIGVSLFVTMLTLSAILIYFNTARQVADVVSDRGDIAKDFDRIVNSDKFEDELSGIEIRSLITKYAGDTSVRINIVKIGDEEVDEYNNINNSTSWIIKVDQMSYMIREDKLDMIEPTWTNRVNKVEKQRTHYFRYRARC